MIGFSKNQPIRRAMLVTLALIANLFANGVPLAHALAHDQHAEAHTHESHGRDHDHALDHRHAHDDERSRETAGPHPAAMAKDSHEEDVHPPSLHEDLQLLPRLTLSFDAVVPSETWVAPFLTVSVERSLPLDKTASSRAPPLDLSARGPPLA